MAAETRSLTDTVVAITGASAGIGQATARQLVEAGARVVLGARRVERLDALVAAAVQRFGRLDSVVANAGIGAYGSVMDGDDELIARMIDTNYTGTVWTVRAAVPALRAAGGGDIVIVSSVAGLRGGGDEAVYAGTKFAQVGLAGALDRELREEGIRVTAILPAGVETEFAMGAGREPGQPVLATYLRDDDVAFAIVTTLRQPRRVRTTQWALWSMGQQS